MIRLRLCNENIPKLYIFVEIHMGESRQVARQTIVTDSRAERLTGSQVLDRLTDRSEEFL